MRTPDTKLLPVWCPINIFVEAWGSRSPLLTTKLLQAGGPVTGTRPLGGERYVDFHLTLRNCRPSLKGNPVTRRVA